LALCSRASRSDAVILAFHLGVSVTVRSGDGVGMPWWIRWMPGIAGLWFLYRGVVWVTRGDGIGWAGIAGGAGLFISCVALEWLRRREQAKTRSDVDDS
jgi:hypothetical protein